MWLIAGFWLLVLLLLVLLPFLFAQLMAGGLEKLHISPGAAFWLALAIMFGGMINIPVRRGGGQVARIDPFAAYRLPGPWTGMPMPGESMIAVNLGGCVIPVAIALYELWHLAARGPNALLIAGAVVLANVVLSYRMARPVPGVGIVVPLLLSPALSALLALLLAGDYAPPVAFVAGVAGPLIGADLLHLRDLDRRGIGVASIGGAGTFDGIVLSGIVAAYLA